MIWQIFFWICIGLMLHSYVLFPLILELFSRKKMENDIVYLSMEELPPLTLFMSAYNEEKVIRKKIESVMHCSYPKHLLKFFIGSDCSTDQTVAIIRSFQAEYSNLILENFSVRSGKSSVLNKLVEMEKQNSAYDESIYVFTDANIIFAHDTLYQLAKHFKNPEIAVVGANVLPLKRSSAGISFQESSYIERENRIKYQEGLIWGKMIGAFGACYAIRSRRFAPVPENFLMEDFFITMNAIISGKNKSISNLKAICYEDISEEISEEYKRKIRISAGNFQNLSRFWKLLFKPLTGLGFSFISHKVIRWLGPFLILFSIISSGLVAGENNFYATIFITQCVLLLMPLIDFILKKQKIENVLLRFISYFYLMNFALLVGFLKFIKGIRTNVWQPTKRV